MGNLFKTTTAGGGQVTSLGNGAWRLGIPAGKEGSYRLAQLDDYARLRRARFPWRAPVSMRLQARASGEDIGGTWGFGVWNDPFSFSLGFSGAARRLPALPNTAWFFNAAAPNYLSLRDDRPAQGFLAASFLAPRLPAALLAPAAPLLPLLAWPPAARALRRMGRAVVQQDAAALSLSAVEWHSYALTWTAKRVIFEVDAQRVFETTTAPGGALGFVVWIDNQYAALPPDGRMAYGTLPTREPAWIEIKDICIQ
ncbi:MAG: hypothetical protein OEZ02_03905 [Anaerolineae bacterium]|nr:hypothetical protein [Anaerolineae bacterium]